MRFSQLRRFITMQAVRFSHAVAAAKHKYRINIDEWPLFYQMMLPTGLLMAILMIALITTAFAFGRAQMTSDAVTHTYEVLQGASAVEKSIVDMETGVRGFALTDNEAFLEPYIKGKGQVN